MCKTYLKHMSRREHLIYNIKNANLKRTLHTTKKQKTNEKINPYYSYMTSEEFDNDVLHVRITKIYIF